MSVLCLQLHIVFNLKNMLMLLCEGGGRMCNCTLLQCVSVCHAGLVIMSQGEGDRGESMCPINTHCNY